MSRAGPSGLSDRVRAAAAGVAETVRQPAYTGENRCTPCTVVNTVLLALASGAVALLVSPVAALPVALVGVGAIALRGYLVPYTPTLTKRYLPDAVLARFDKLPERIEPAENSRLTGEGSTGVTAAVGGESDASDGRDVGSAGASPTSEPETPTVERLLVDAAVLVPAGADYRLAESFRTVWRDRIATRDAAADPEALLSLGSFSDVSPDDVTFERRSDAFLASVDGRLVADWESAAAARVDFAAAPLLAERSDHWDRLDFDARTEVLAGLRLWLDACPDCESAVSLGRDTVESCCRAVPVIAGSCDGCGVRLFEAPVPEDVDPDSEVAPDSADVEPDSRRESASNSHTESASAAEGERSAGVRETESA
ncbi:hypothetical protein RYH80_14810 [Halobaculum sp. MBLA0147]|uniref:hypothetical protein n=1 Tax=Halobaculum sp. MBLA0147 TaxID=3079934 RepID=UPI00352691B3